MKETILKYVGFAETLFKGKNALLVEKNDRQVSKGVQNTLFLHSFNRFNHGGYVVNLSNHIRE
jgi:hypothetical protein